MTLSQALTDTPATIILSTPRTSDMNFMTSDQVFCLYPQLIRQGISLRVGRENGTDNNTIRTLRARGMKFYLSTLDRRWAGACGTCCPGIWRSVADPYGVGVVYWGGLSRCNFLNCEDKRCLLDRKLKWTLGGHCNNSECEFRGLSAMFERYVVWCVYIDIGRANILHTR